MKIKIISTIKTNNFTDPNLVSKISEMWSKSIKEIDKSSVFYGLYYNYENNYEGDYSLSVAVESNENRDGINIPEDKYKIFHVDNPEKNGIINTWKKIWEEEEKNNIERSYTYDYEKYLPNGNVDIYIAIK